MNPGLGSSLLYRSNTLPTLFPVGRNPTQRNLTALAISNCLVLLQAGPWGTHTGLFNVYFYFYFYFPQLSVVGGRSVFIFYIIFPPPVTYVCGGLLPWSWCLGTEPHDAGTVSASTEARGCAPSLEASRREGGRKEKEKGERRPID
jgi:hypothetical protein